MFIEKAIIEWHSAKQSGIENSFFGSEFTVMKTDLETVQGICEKLMMMSVWLSLPMRAKQIRTDSMSVINNACKPESALEKRQIWFVSTALERQLQLMIAKQEMIAPMRIHLMLPPILFHMGKRETI